MALAHRNEKVRLVLDRRFECGPILLDEITVQRGAAAATRYAGVLEGRRLHVDEPALARRAGLVAGETHGLVDGVGEAGALPLLVGGGRLGAGRGRGEGSGLGTAVVGSFAAAPAAEALLGPAEGGVGHGGLVEGCSTGEKGGSRQWFRMYRGRDGAGRVEVCGVVFYAWDGACGSRLEEIKIKIEGTERALVGLRVNNAL